ncbi:MAG: tetratricopeptide repeat protein [Candidatus Omnitrophota bacterium]|jgi:tetratricopeptide (TPR) repeat protein
MGLRRSFLLVIFLLLFFNLAYAGELTAQEAVNYYNEGVKAQRAGNFTMAESSYQKALFVDPYNRNWQKLILNNRAVIYAQQGDLEKAEAALYEVLEMDPDYRPAQLNLGFIYEQGRSELESIKYWLGVLNINLDEVKPKDFVIEEALEAGK